MSKELGTLAIVVLKAKNLHDRHSFYKQDPYAAVTLNGKTFKTPADVKGGQHPEWDAEFRFPVYASKNDSSRQLEVTCWRAEPKADEEIGKGKVDIEKTLNTGEFDDWVTIKDVSGTYRGEIYLEMTFFASGPPSLERRPSKLPPQERLHHLKKQSTAPVTGGNLAVPGGASVHLPSRMDKPLPSVHEQPGPGPLPSILRPGSGPGSANGHGRRQSEYTSPITSQPPASLFPGRPPTSPVPIQQQNNPNSFRIPTQHSHSTLSTSGYDLSPSPPRPGHSPPRLGHSPPHLSHSPPRIGHSPPQPSHSPPRPSYSPPRQNPYVSDPVPQSDSGFFPSPYIVVDSTPPVTYNPYDGGPSYSPPQPSPPRHSPPQPPSSSSPTNTPSFPSASQHRPSPSFHPPQPTSSSYPPLNYPPSQPGYPEPQSTYYPSHSGYPVQPPPQFPSHYQPQDTYSTYGHTSPAPGLGQRPFFGREDSIDLPDPALVSKYSSPLPLPDDGRPQRGSSPFPVPSIPPPPHPVSTRFSPSAEYERELQRRREQEERDEELARQLDLELNLGS